MFVETLPQPEGGDKISTLLIWCLIQSLPTLLLALSEEMFIFFLFAFKYFNSALCSIKNKCEMSLFWVI